jgi:hypothetical protein
VSELEEALKATIACPMATIRSHETHKFLDPSVIASTAPLPPPTELLSQFMQFDQTIRVTESRHGTE